MVQQLSGRGASEESAPLRVGVVGAGANARQKHLPALAAIPGVEIVAVANRSEASARRVAGDFGIPRAYADWRRLLREERTDAIFIGTWPDTHRDIAVAALDAGNHVLVEARLARTATEARDILAAARRQPGRIVQVVPAGFSFEQDATIRRLVETEVGDLVAVEGTFHEGGFVCPDAPLHWRQDRGTVGVNIMTVARRYENLLRWLPPVTGVVAGGRVTVPQRVDPRSGRTVPVELPDVLTVVGTFRGGAHLSLTISSVTGHGPPLMVRIYGTTATVVFNGDTGTVLLGRRGDDELRPVDVPSHERRRRRPADDFVAAIRGQRPPGPTSLTAAVAYMEFADAVDRSLGTGRWADVRAAY